MRDFIDKTPEQVGTPLNRDNLMAIQGFDSADTIFIGDNSIRETNASGDVLTTAFNDEIILETFVGKSGKTITKKTTFNNDGSITEEVY
jgi:hypothetical protein